MKHYVPIFLITFFLSTSLIGMDLIVNTEPMLVEEDRQENFIDQETNITLLTQGNHVNPDITFVEKKYLNESIYFKHFFESCENLTCIDLRNSIHYPINQAILKQLLLPCLQYIYVINHKDASPLYKHNTHQALNTFLVNLNDYSLHTLINHANYFEIPYLFNLAFRHWATRVIRPHELQLLCTNPNHLLTQRYYFPPDLQRQAIMLIMKNILAYLKINHLRNGQISHTKLLGKTHTHAFWCAKFNPHNNLVAAGSSDKKIYLDTPAKGYVHILEGSTSAANALTFAPKHSHILASGDMNGVINIWNTNTYQHIKTFTGQHTRVIHDLCFSPDETLLASACADNTIGIWDIQKSICTHVLQGHTHNVWKLYFADNSTLYSASTDKTIRVWNINKGEEIKHFGPSFGELAFHKNIIATDRENYDIHLIDRTNNTVITTLSGHTDCLRCLCFSPDGTLLASASDDDTIKIWDIETKQCVRTLEHEDNVNSICFSSDGNLLLSASSDKTTRLWNIFPRTVQISFSYLSNLHRQDLDNHPMEQALFLNLLYQRTLAQKESIIRQPHLHHVYHKFSSKVQQFLARHFIFFVHEPAQQQKRKRAAVNNFKRPNAKRRKKT